MGKFTAWATSQRAAQDALNPWNQEVASKSGKKKTRRTDLATAGVGTAEQRHVLVQQGGQVAEWAPVKERTGRRIERRSDAASGIHWCKGVPPGAV